MSSFGLDDGAPGFSSGRGADTLVCVAVFLFTFWYCASAPYNLYVYDEGYFLYEAKRIVEGDVFYRDFFNFVAPLAWYIMAAAYWLFGVTMATARTTMAVIHGLIAVGMVVACRIVGIRLSIAAVAALSETAISYLAIERAAPHWFGTLWDMGVLLVLLRRAPIAPAAAYVAGLFVGASALTQQPRGVSMFWVPLAIFALDRALGIGSRGRVWRWATTYVAGVATLVVPTLTILILLAGFERVFDALVRFPLVNYRDVVHAAWGTYHPLQNPYAGPIIRYLSIPVPIMAILRCLWLWWVGKDVRVCRQLAVVALVSVGALFGIRYGAGYGYIVLVGPVWFILVAELLETTLQAGERRWRRAWLGSIAIVAAMALLFAFNLWARRRELNAQWPYEADTPFGTMRFASEADIVLLDAVRSAVGAKTASPGLFIYPTAPGLYLLTGTKNITRFQIVVAGYSSPEHVQEVIDRLEEQRQPFVIRNWIWMDNEADPILKYLMEKYEKVHLPYPPKQMRPMTLFRRKPEAPAGATF